MGGIPYSEVWLAGTDFLPKSTAACKWGEKHYFTMEKADNSYLSPVTKDNITLIGRDVIATLPL